MSDIAEMPTLEDVSPEIRRVMDIDIPPEDMIDGIGGISRSSNFQSHEIQRIAKWIERMLPFSLLFLIVFIHYHLQGIATFCFSLFVILICFSC